MTAAVNITAIAVLFTIAKDPLTVGVIILFLPRFSSTANTKARRDVLLLVRGVIGLLFFKTLRSRFFAPRRLQYIVWLGENFFASRMKVQGRERGNKNQDQQHYYLAKKKSRSNYEKSSFYLLDFAN